MGDTLDMPAGHWSISTKEKTYMHPVINKRTVCLDYTLGFSIWWIWKFVFFFNSLAAELRETSTVQPQYVLLHV